MRQIVHLERISTGCVPCTHPTDPMSKPAPLSLILVSCLAVAILGCNEGPTAGPSSDAPSEDAASDSTSGTDGAEEAGLADLLPDASAEAGTPDTPTSDNVAEDVEHDGPSSQDLAVDGDGPADTAGDRSLTDGLDDEPHAAGDADAAAVDLAIDETDGDGSDSGSAWTPPHPTWEEACGWRRWPEGCACDHMELLNCCVREDLFECPRRLLLGSRVRGHTWLPAAAVLGDGPIPLRVRSGEAEDVLFRRRRRCNGVRVPRRHLAVGLERGARRSGAL